MRSDDQVPRPLRGGPRRQVATGLAQCLALNPVPIRELAATLKRKPSSVRRLLNEAGVRNVRACLGMTTSEVATELLRRHHAGASIERMSRDTGLDRREIRRILTDQDAAPRHRHPLPTDQLTWVIKQYEHGATLRQLAALTGSSYTTVRRELLAAGVPLRGRGPTGKEPQ